MRDFETRKDIEEMLQEFYDRATKDPLIGPKFKDIDMKEHIPVIVDFWESILFGTSKYQRNAFERHIRLDLKREHFERWLSIFEETVRARFRGKKADHSIYRAQSIAQIFSSKLDRLRKHHS